MTMRRMVCGLGLVLVALATASCARFGLGDLWPGGRDKEAPGPQAQAPAGSEAAPAPVAASEADREALLRQAIAEHIAANSGDETRMVRRRPYFYKEYSVYSEGPDAARVTVTETDSRLTPYLASVEIDKQRFATRLHRERDEAVADRNFLRDTGTETLSYEWRGGHWEKVGSLFVAGATEEQINGQWVAVQEPEQRTVAAEEEESQGLLGRVLSIFGD